MKILGIDPGTTFLGYAIIEPVKGENINLIDWGVLDLRKLKTHFEKLSKIAEQVQALLHKYPIDQAAIESPFYGKNVQSMLKLGRAQGVAIAIIMQRGIPVFEYAPKRIKIAITGNGNASKLQVAKMLQTLLGISIDQKRFDQTDALAVAVCHYFNLNTVEKPTYNSWKDFARRQGLID